MRVRILEQADEPVLERFLRTWSDSSMILRSNLHSAGVVDRGLHQQGTYAAAFEGDAIVGVVAHYWNGNLIPQASRGLARLTRTAVAASGRAVAGAVGPGNQVRRALRAVGLGDSPVRVDSREGLYAVALRNLRVPEMLRAQRISARPIQASDRERVTAWLERYEVEALGARPGRQTRANAERRFDLELGSEPAAHVLLRDGEHVSFAGFNARLPDSVQVGGVYTPPHERGKGFARSVVASALAAARARGLERAVLFTGDANASAIAAYTALGFTRVGDFGVVLLSRARAAA